MKVTSVIILFLVLKAEASFFSDFTGAMSSVKSAFGKLLNDVVSDVKTTVRCTILAMEQVLAMNGIVPKPLTNKECYEDDNNKTFEKDLKKDNRNLYYANDIAQEIRSSISEVNKTLSHVLGDSHKRLEDVKREIKNESYRLTEVSYLLRQELEKISQGLKKEFQNIHIESNKSSLESVWNNMKILYEVEKNNKNISKEIGQVFNEALNVLHINTNSEVKSDKEKIKAIIQELQHESNSNNVPNNTINRELSQWKDETALQNNLEHKAGGLPKSFKDVAKVFKHTNELGKERTDKSNSVANSKLPKIQTKNDSTKSSKSDSQDDSPFSDTNSKDYSKAVDQAMDILKNTANTQTLLDDFFAKEQGVDVFDNSNLLNFKK